MTEPRSPTCYTSLFDMLIAQREDILYVWMSRIRLDTRIPSSDEMSAIALKDHLPQLLNQIVIAMARSKAGMAEADEAAQKVADSQAAQSHIAERLACGYSLVETIRELAHLRSELVSRWVRARVPPNATDLEVLHSSIDEVMASAAEEAVAVAETAENSSPVS